MPFRGENALVRVAVTRIAPDGGLESRFSRDFLLTVITLYWVTGIISSIRDYYDNRRSRGEPRLGPSDHIYVPPAVAVFRTCSSPRPSHRGNGPNGSTTSTAGPSCPAAGTAPRRRTPACRPRHRGHSSAPWTGRPTRRGSTANLSWPAQNARLCLALTQFQHTAAEVQNGGSCASSLTGALTECDKSKGTWPTPKTCFASSIAIAQCAGV